MPKAGFDFFDGLRRLSQMREYIGQGKRKESEKENAIEEDAWDESCCDFGGQLAAHQSRRKKRVEAMGTVEALLVFPVAAFCFAVVSGRIRADQFVPYAKVKGGLLEKGFDFAL